VLLAACTPLRPLDPAGDGGVRTDAATRDAPGLDAPALDAPGLDAGTVDVGTPADAWAADAPSPPDAAGPDAGCIGGPRCVGSMLRTCDRGMPIDTACSVGCIAAGTPHCGELVASNIPSTLLTVGTMDYMASDGFMVDTSSCPELSLMGLTLGPVVQGDGSEVCVLAVGSLTVPGGATMRVTGSRPFVLAVARDVTIAGTLDASAVGVSAGAGGGAGGMMSTAARGPSPGGPGMRAGTSTTDDGGGGGGGACPGGPEGRGGLPGGWRRKRKHVG